MKRISAFMLALVMCLGLAACSGGSAPKNENSVSQSESTSDRQMPGEDEYSDRLGDAKETAYEVVSTDAEVISYFGKWGQILFLFLVPLTGLEPVLWKPERDFKSRVSTYSTTAACSPMTGDMKLHNKCQPIATAYGSIFSAYRQVLQLVEIQREGLQTVI